MYAGTARTVISTLKARSDDQVLRIQFFGSKNWKQALGRSDFKVPFCGKNVERSFVVCSHHRFFRTNKESSIWRQNNHAKFVGAFHLSKRISDENRAYFISIRFFKITDPFDARSEDPFFGTNK